MEGASNTGVVTPLMTEAGDGGENFTVEKPKIVPAARMVVSEHPGRNPYLEATAHAADQMQIDTERLGKNTIPETQASEYPASDNFLAGMREHAGQIGPDTAQSSLTLVQDSGQPLHLKESPESADPAPEIRTPGLPATGQQ